MNFVVISVSPQGSSQSEKVAVYLTETVSNYSKISHGELCKQHLLQVVF